MLGSMLGMEPTKKKFFFSNTENNNNKNNSAATPPCLWWERTDLQGGQGRGRGKIEEGPCKTQNETDYELRQILTSPSAPKLHPTFKESPREPRDSTIFFYLSSHLNLGHKLFLINRIPF